MKLLAVNSARAIWLVKTIFLNPRGRSLIPAVIGLAERYKFTGLPTAADINKQPLELRFENGTFAGKDGIPTTVNVTVYDDGFIADTRSSTNVSDEFLEDMISWVTDVYALPKHNELAIEKLYASDLVVQMNLSGNIFSAKFSEFVAKLRKGTSNSPGHPLELFAMHFAPNPGTAKRTAPFKFERLPNAPFEKNEFVSHAPVGTSEHMELLELLERAGQS